MSATCVWRSLSFGGILCCPLHPGVTLFDGEGFDASVRRAWHEGRVSASIIDVIGVLTTIVTSVEITGGYGADSSQFVPLVKATARNFSAYQVSADKAYSSRENLEAVDNARGRAYIPFKVNATAREMHDSRKGLWDRLYHYYHLHRESFLRHYHARSLSESTFSMMKAMFGNALRSKTDVALVNELLCKMLCHNLCCLIQSM